jgi:hypothetical protein
MRQGNEVNLVKIDVEGFEDSVEGMDIIMNTMSPRLSLSAIQMDLIKR